MGVEFSVDDASTRLSELVDRAAAGEDIVITRGGVASVRLQSEPVTSAPWVTVEAGDTFDVGTGYWPGTSAG